MNGESLFLVLFSGLV